MSYVTDVYVISRSSQSQIIPPSGYTKIDVDLNKGAGGKYIYLCYKSGDKADAITGLQVGDCQWTKSILCIQRYWLPFTCTACSPCVHIALYAACSCFLCHRY